MKKTIFWLISVLLIGAIMLSGSSCSMQPKSAYKQLYDHILEKGEKYIDKYMLMHLAGDSSFVMYVDKNEKIWWILSKEEENFSTFMEMQLCEDSAIHEVYMSYEYKGIDISSSGIISTSTFSHTNPLITSYTSTGPAQAYEQEKKMFTSHVNLMFAYAHTVLEDSPVTMADLGFTSYGS